MLIQRIITGLLLVLALLALILWAPELWFQLVIAGVLLLAAWEWAQLAGVNAGMGRLLYSLSLAPLLWLALNYLDYFPWLAALSLAWWLLATLLVSLYPRYQARWAHPALLLLAGYLVLVPGWQALLFLKAQYHGAFLLLLMLALIAMTDIGAYFSGRLLGRHKLAPQVSPNKTWEGFWGGWLCCILLMLAVLAIHGGDLGVSWPAAPLFLLAVGMMAVLGVIGDLLESMLKRRVAIKDSGNLLPGHGGILDRIDSITAAAPAFALLIYCWGKF